ncbi:hypothetical protein [Pseudomonas sp.]|jgi:hypothetical protein|uniref:hypothetical protein n=1 Tax=Pseudomonas sp. TaxID=306 RepID=UPI0028AAD212|nr:hypothetical protein [Pseudomonas sp.]
MPEAAELSNASRGDSPDVDWLIRKVILLANMGIPTPITLTIPSGLVSGIIISGKEYLDAFHTQLTGYWDQAAAAKMLEYVEEWKAIYEVPVNGNDEKNIAYIHLRDAKVFTGGQFVPTNEGVLWRGKITAISGFTIGIVDETD